MILLKSSHPSVFQGNLKKKRYFEGWYFKLVSADGRYIFSIIPGVSLSSESHAFIQVIEGKTGKTDYISFNINAFTYSTSKFEIQIENNRFSNEQISLNFSGEQFSIKGNVSFEKSVTWESTFLAPGIMGWYNWVPFMECYHDVVSLDHQLRGILNINAIEVDFSSGKGYTEKDWGTSFPECWVWTQANCFNIPGTSFMFSVAKIPWLGKYFIGHLCFVLYRGTIYKFMTWNNTKVSSLKHNNNQIFISLSGKDHDLEVIITSSISGKIIAPVLGVMERYIKESVNASISLKLALKDGKEIFRGTSVHAGLEVVGDVFQYFNS